MSLRSRLADLLQQPDYSPLDIDGLCAALGLKHREFRKVAHEVRLLVSQGEAVLVRGDRYAPASAADPSRVVGRISFRAGGSAIVVPETRVNASGPRQIAVQIASEDTGTAFHGDRVEVERFDGSGFGGGRRQRGRDARGGERAGRYDPREPRGRVVSVLERASDTMVGTLARVAGVWRVVADDPRFVYDILVPDPNQKGSKVRPAPAAGDKVVVRLAEWTRPHRAPEGEIIERLGRQWEPRAELMGVYRKFDLDPKFPADVVREAATLPDRVPASDLAGRLDYRAIPTFTIDPDDAKDFDDALSVEELPDGDLRVGVHIADVSSYVRPGTALDREAQRRGNSTYLVGTVVPMLPEKLSNGLCSLVEGEDRLTKAVLFTYDPKGRLTHTAYASTVIRSRKRLTYKQAYALLFAGSLDEVRALPLPPKHQTGSTGRALSELSDAELVDLQSWVRRLWRIASRLRSSRMKNGALDLDMPETKIFVDEAGYADRLERIENDESHQLIEEFMLAANEAVARLTREQKLASVYRVHDEPEEEKLAELRQFLTTFGVVTDDLTKRGALTGLIETLREHPQGYTLRTQLLRSLKKACYRPTPDGHFGLHMRDYTHFTSPIRRYPDLVVHRVLDVYLVKNLGYPVRPGMAAYTPDSLDRLAEHLSLTEVNSMEAERESQKIKLIEFFERELVKTRRTRFSAAITDVRGQGLFIELTDTSTFGFIRASDFGDDSFHLTPGGDAFIGRISKRRLAVGTTVDVEIARVDKVKRQLDFKLAPEAPGKATSKRGAKAPTAKPKEADLAPTPTRKGGRGKPRESAKGADTVPEQRPIFVPTTLLKQQVPQPTEPLRGRGKRRKG